ncbi:MAG: cyclic nucleotide-binding/CBS domain-containing protein [Candidatus Thorarchaeota archaeon]
MNPSNGLDESDTLRSNDIGESDIRLRTLLTSLTKEIVTMSANRPVAEAAKLMMDHKIGSVLLTADEGVNGDIIGIITKGDIITRVVGRGLDPGIIIADDVMSSPVHIVSEDETLENTMLLMSQYDIERMLVVDEEDRPLAIVSTNDILRFSPGLLRIRRERLLIESLPNDVNHTKTLFKGFCDDCGNYSEELSSMSGYTLCPDCLLGSPMDDDHITDDDIM